MCRSLSPIAFFLAACAAYAQDEKGAGIPPSDTVSLTWVVVFLVLFVGSIVGFFFYLWWRERNRKDEE